MNKMNVFKGLMVFSLSVLITLSPANSFSAFAGYSGYWVKDADDRPYYWETYNGERWFLKDRTNASVENTWKLLNGKWYYLGKSGLMAIDWIWIDGKWYYCAKDGAMMHDTWIDGKYYVGSDGALYTDRTTPDGYKVNSDGEWVPDNQKAQYTIHELQDEFNIRPGFFGKWAMQKIIPILNDAKEKELKVYTHVLTDNDCIDFLSLYQYFMRNSNGFKSDKVQDNRIHSGDEVERESLEYMNFITFNDMDNIIYEYLGCNANTEEWFHSSKFPNNSVYGTQSGIQYMAFHNGAGPTFGSSIRYYEKYKLEFSNSIITMSDDNINITGISIMSNDRYIGKIDMSLKKQNNLLGCQLKQATIVLR